MKHIVFDLDGTLIDSMPLWENLGHAFLNKQNIPMPENFNQEVKILTIVQTAQYFHDVVGLNMSVNEITEDLISYIRDAYLYEVPLKPFVREYLEQEKKAGTRMCVLTASERSYIYPAMERLDILQYFDTVLTCTELGHFKSEATVFHMAMEEIGGTLENTIVFEDAIYAIASAKKGGHMVYAVEDAATAADREEIAKLADKCITSYKELLLP